MDHKRFKYHTYMMTMKEIHTIKTSYKFHCHFATHQKLLMCNFHTIYASLALVMMCEAYSAMVESGEHFS